MKCLTTLFCGILASAGPLSVWADDVTKEDIIKLSKAKLGDQTIITFIQSKGAAFDLSADEIVDLRQAGVSEAVLAAMIESGRGSKAMDRTPNPEVSLPTAPPAPVEERPVVYDYVEYVEDVPVNRCGGYRVQYDTPAPRPYVTHSYTPFYWPIHVDIGHHGHGHVYHGSGHHGHGHYGHGGHH